MNSTYKYRYCNIAPLVLGAMLLFGCTTEDIEIVSALAQRDNVPTMTAKNSEILYTEEGLLRIQVIAPSTKYFQFSEEPYTEFPDGITVNTFTDSLEIESTLTANYAIYYEPKKLWVARYNVIARNNKNEVLYTEQLFWDEDKKIIYSDDHVKIDTPDGIIFGEGFQSDENFNDWEIRRTSGIIYIDE